MKKYQAFTKLSLAACTLFVSFNALSCTYMTSDCTLQFKEGSKPCNKSYTVNKNTNAHYKCYWGNGLCLQSTDICSSTSTSSKHKKRAHRQQHDKQTNVGKRVGNLQNHSE